MKRQSKWISRCKLSCTRGGSVLDMNGHKAIPWSPMSRGIGVAR